MVSWDRTRLRKRTTAETRTLAARLELKSVFKMKDILHSVYIKHDTSFKSLSKRALAQIILKIVYLSGQQGIPTNKLQQSLLKHTGVKFQVGDIDESLARLRNPDNKINTKSGRHFIKESYRESIGKAVKESENLHDDVVKHWFGKSQTYKETEGIDILKNWILKLLVDFFQEYSYDWINDLRSKQNGKKKSPNLSVLIDKSFSKTKIVVDDFEWLKKQFVQFIESERKEDTDLLWIYGSSMFSATLLTARNYADDFGLEIFKNSDFILDTNILMILELEGFEHNYAIKMMEETFKKLNVSTKYFYISKLEYNRAIGPKRDATLAAVDKYDMAVIMESDCPFIQTALRRQCRTIEDFELFFDQIIDPPKTFGKDLILECDDYAELKQAVEMGEADDEIKSDIDKIYRRRTNHDKREKPKQHDSGLIAGAEFKKKSKKCWILTRDGTLRELAFDRTVRDENPIAIGLDSLIQMLAINSGGSELSSTEFAPLFGKLVRSSLVPEKSTFQMEDLFFIEKTRIQISELSNEQIVEIAKKVNKLRLQGVSDDDIALEIQRYFQTSVLISEDELLNLKGDKLQLTKEKERVEQESENLESTLKQKEFDEAIKRLKWKVGLSWLKIIAIPILISLSTIIIIKITPLNETIDSNLIVIVTGVLTELIASLVIIRFGKYKLSISDEDKSEVEKKVRAKMLNLKSKR